MPPLRAPAAPATVPQWGEELTPADLHELWEERAAIMEFDGGLRREFAETEARRDVTRRWPLARSTEPANTKGA